MARRAVALIAVAAVVALALVALVKPASPPFPYHQQAHVHIQIEAPENRTFDVVGTCDVFDAATPPQASGLAAGTAVVARVVAGPIVTVGSSEFHLDVELWEQASVAFPIFAAGGYGGGTTTLAQMSSDRGTGRARFDSLQSDGGWMFPESDKLSGQVEWRCDGPTRTFEPEGGVGG